MIDATGCLRVVGARAKLLARSSLNTKNVFIWSTYGHATSGGNFYLLAASVRNSTYIHRYIYYFIFFLRWLNRTLTTTRYFLCIIWNVQNCDFEFISAYNVQKINIHIHTCIYLLEYYFWVIIFLSTNTHYEHQSRNWEGGNVE